MSETEKSPAEVFATIIGMTVKYIEYTKPKALARRFIFKNV